MKALTDKYIVQTCTLMTPEGERVRGISVYEMLEDKSRGTLLEQHEFETEELPVNSECFTHLTWKAFCEAHKNAAYSYNSTI